MLMGKVVGTVVSTRKDEKLGGLRFLVIRELDEHMKETGKVVVAADSVQAGVGEVVLAVVDILVDAKLVLNGAPYAQLRQ